MSIRNEGLKKAAFRHDLLCEGANKTEVLAHACL